MKKLHKTLIILIFIILTFTLKVYAHGGNITGWKDKNSNKIMLYNGSYYGYHNESGERHYHQVQWNEEKQKWEILKSAVYYDETFSIMQKSSDIDAKKVEVTFYTSVDGDTAKFELNGEIITARFLGINTRETVAPNMSVEKWGQEASDYTKDMLQNAIKIEIEYDDKASKKDKYYRDLVWIWVDDELLQEKLVLEGLAEQYMLQSNYKYADVIQEAESIAKGNKLGIWSDKTEIIDENETDVSNSQDNIVMLIIVIVLSFIVVLVNKLVHRNEKK